MMRPPCRWTNVLAFLFLFVPSTRAQLDLITFNRPFQTRNLTGVVVDSMGAPVAGVVIEDCVQTFRQVRASGDAEPPVFEKAMILDCHFEPKHVLASTTTDSEGRFRFPHAKMGTIHYLHVSCNGWDPMQLQVKIRRFARASPLIKLHIAS
jgi:hypothetical protein